MTGPADWPYPAHCAHRGAGKLAPENTLAAFRVGADYGYRMFEFDVKLSGDGAIILMHDDTAERTTDGNGRIAELTLGQLMRLDAGSWHSPGFTGEGVPTFTRVARWLLASEYFANIEIKPCTGREYETGAAVATEADLLFRDAEFAPLLSSFSEVALQGARAAAPDLPRALLCDNLTPDWADRCLALGCVAFDPHHLLLTEDIIDQAHDVGLRILTYTVNDPKRAQQLLAWGVDTVITDAIDQIAADDV
ncbi:MAG: glycerophosphodiester phosphodiesterase [Burkholderiaceae bacterium]